MIEHWAAKHGVTAAALSELRELLGAMTVSNKTDGSGSEALVQSNIRLEASQKGVRLWRNNVGALYSQDGRFIRFGLCNDSKRMNEMVKSSDLIGIRPLRITEAYVGTTVGQFIAREVKSPGWAYRNTNRERAQLEFLTLISTMGGDARFASAVGTI